MKAVLILIFLALTLLAAGFAIWPVLRRPGDSRAQKAMLAGIVALFVLGTAAGSYLFLGSPGLALRTLAGPRPDDLPGLIAQLVTRTHDHPKDARAWDLLGRGYLTIGAPDQAAGAFRKEAALAGPEALPGVLSAMGEALTLANQGQVPDEAVSAFETVLRLDPKNVPARFYIGLAFANRRQPQRAEAIWQQLIDEAPPDAPYRQMLIDRLANLKMQSVQSGQGGPPDIGAMVARLAASLKAQPNNPGGWQRLIRAYAVLGEKDKARSALTDARAALKADAAALSAIEAEAKGLGL